MKKIKFFLFYDTCVCFIIGTEAPETPTGPIKFSDVLATSLTMEWSASRSDGGSPIQSYKIELTTDKKNWVTVMTCDRYTTKVKVRDLITDQRYHFRVSAVNQVGSSEPLMSDEVTPIKPPGMFLCGYLIAFDVNMF